MGLETRDTSKVYLDIMGGDFVRKVKPETEGAEKRINKNNNEVWELKYSAVEGRIIGIDMDSHDEYGERVILTLQDGDDVFVVNFKFPGRHADSFLVRAENIDQAYAVKLVPYSFEDENGKRRSGVSVYQDGEKIESKYTKDDPGDMPELEKKKGRGGKIEWNSTDRDNWFADLINDTLKEKFSGLGGSLEDEEPVSEAASEGEEEDDLPF